MKALTICLLASLLAPLCRAHESSDREKELQKEVASLRAEVELLKKKVAMLAGRPKVEVPPTEEPPARLAREVLLTLAADGSVFVDDKKIDRKDLREKLKAISEVDADQPVRIRGEGGVTYQVLTKLIDDCREAGIWNIAFSTRKNGDLPKGEEEKR